MIVMQMRERQQFNRNNVIDNKCSNIEEEIKAIEFTNSEIESMRESLLHKRDYLYSLPALNFKKTGIESLDELIKYIKESIDKDIDEINYICSKLR